MFFYICDHWINIISIILKYFRDSNFLQFQVWNNVCYTNLTFFSQHKLLRILFTFIHYLFLMTENPVKFARLNCFHYVKMKPFEINYLVLMLLNVERLTVIYSRCIIVLWVLVKILYHLKPFNTPACYIRNIEVTQWGVICFPV